MTLQEAKDAAAKEVFHMKFDRALVKIITGEVNFTTYEVHSVIDKAILLYGEAKDKEVEELKSELRILRRRFNVPPKNLSGMP